MLRRIPAKLLVCLAVLLSTFFVATSWAAAAEQPTELALKPSNTGSSPVPMADAARSRDRARSKSAMGCVPGPVWGYPPTPIVKVKPGVMSALPMFPETIFPSRRASQWEMSGQVLFARLRGKVQMNCYPYCYGGSWGMGQDIGFTDFLGLPVHQAVGEFNVRYQFRPNWALRYSILGLEMNGSGGTDNYYWYGYGQGMQTKWNHYYHRLGLMYDAVRTPRAKVSVFADWVHTDDRLSMNSPYYGTYLGAQSYNKNGDSAMVGMEFQRAIRSYANRSTLSLDCKAGGMFLDNVEGWDVQAGARYSVPLNCGRSGYAKGGYRYVEIKKSESNIAFNHALEGGFMEFGFIF